VYSRSSRFAKDSRLDISTVIAASNATCHIQSGQMDTVDGGAGTVELKENEKK